MIDGLAFIYELLRRDVDDDISVAADLDVSGDLTEYPAITFAMSDTADTANGDGLWSFSLTLNVLADGLDATKALAGVVHDILVSWDQDPGRTYLPDIGSMPWITVGVFSFEGAAITSDRNINQYTGVSTLALRTIQ